MKVLRSILPWLPIAVIATGMWVLLTLVVSQLDIGNGSMEPTIPVGARIIIHEQDEYKAGDIITFRADKGEVVTHRLIGFASNGDYVMKGDANPTADVWEDPITKSDVMGKVISMPPIMIPGFWISIRGLMVVIGLLAIGVMLLWRVDDEMEDTPLGKETVSVPHPA